jgi:predicted RNase H-like nuclease (RuvC/YqgF family)
MEQIFEFIIKATPVIMAIITIVFLNKQKKNNPIDISERTLKNEMDIASHSKEIQKLSEHNTKLIDNMVAHNLKIQQLETNISTMQRDMNKFEISVTKELSEQSAMLKKIYNMIAIPQSYKEK